MIFSLTLFHSVSRSVACASTSSCCSCKIHFTVCLVKMDLVIRQQNALIIHWNGKQKRLSTVIVIDMSFETKKISQKICTAKQDFWMRRRRVRIWSNDRFRTFLMHHFIHETNEIVKYFHFPCHSIASQNEEEFNIY